MAIQSMMWTTTAGLGHGVISGYASNRWQAFIRKMFQSDRANTGSVLLDVDNELAVTGTASPLAVATGAILGYGFFVESDTPLSLAVTTPVGGTTGGHVILRVTWATQIADILVVRSANGDPSIPPLTQTPNTVYEVRLATFQITTGGVITLTDTRDFAKFSAQVYGSNLHSSVVDGTTLELAASTLRIKNNGVGDAQLRDSAALSVIGRSANSSGDPADIAAGTDGFVLRRLGTALGFGQLAAGAYGNDTIDYTKTSTGIPQYTHRQGGDATNWDTQGANNYTVGTPRMCTGRSVGVAGAGNKDITFPFTFGKIPNVQATAGSAGGYVLVYNKAVTGFSFAVFNAAGTQVAAEIDWFAVGEE